MTRAALALPALLLTLAACDELPSSDNPNPGTGNPDTCNAERIGAEFVGMDASSVTAAMFAAPTRVIRPGDMVTMDFNPERVNFEVGSDGRIARVYCG